MRVTLLVLILLLSNSSIVFSQKHYHSGYIISHANDTLHGKIKDRKPWPYAKLYKKMRFKSDSFIFRKKFSADEIQGYHVNRRTYESIGITSSSFFLKTTYSINENHRHSFLRIVIKDQLSYYHWEYMDGESQTLEYVPLFYKKGEHEMVRATQGIFGLKKKLLSNYFKECPELVEKINNKEIKSVEEILEFYNTWYEQNH